VVEGRAIRVGKGLVRPDIVKEPATNPIARCPSTREKILEIQRRTWLDRGTLPVRQIVQCDPFGDGSAPNTSFGGDVPEAPPGRMHPFGVDEQGLTGKTALGGARRDGGRRRQPEGGIDRRIN